MLLELLGVLLKIGNDIIPMFCVCISVCAVHDGANTQCGTHTKVDNYLCMQYNAMQFMYMWGILCNIG